MKKKLSVFFILSIILSSNAFANYGNCNNYRDKPGYVDRVAIGVDENNAKYISFSMIINNENTGWISVKQVVTDDEGKAMQSLLMEAARSQELFTIHRCYLNQLAGGSIKFY
ncbi:TPA: hypothetical protein JD250_14130 [Proteus mirabilis]|nr:hypothetical protein [Proteus mirabilis]HAU5535643.1 hypothetical protein [Proteus mirabilis]HAU5539281.1 hypothetical protein [Proteus mirabilis]HAU5542717.1 hypothetical protein [Proteus mirabilis]HAU5573654.1 hypothetical protein [Proteus mirabilis]